MQKIVDDIMSVHWWVMVFIAGIVINVLSKFADKALSQHSLKWATRTKKRREERARRVKDLAANRYILLSEQIDVVHAEVLTVVLMILGLGGLTFREPMLSKIISSPLVHGFWVIVSAIACFGGLLLSFWTLRRRGEIWEARAELKRRMEREGDVD